MALSASRLKADLKARIINRRGPPTDDAQLDGFCEDVANAVITEITTYAVVTASGEDPPGDGGTVLVTGTVG